MTSTPSPVPIDRKDFCCPYCQREFSRLEHLQRHTRRHTHEKPYHCDCGALFSRRDLLRRHERIVHGAINHSTDRRSSRRRAEGAPPTESFRENWSCHGEQSRQANNNTLEGPAISHSTALQSQSRRPEVRTNIQAPSFFPAPRIALSPLSRIQRISQRSNIDIPSVETQILPYFSHPVVTDSQRAILLLAVEGFVSSDLSLPSTNSLTRYLAGYFTGFYPQVPFTHAPTFKLESCSPELCLAMLSVGAVYRHEFHSAVKLFSVAKTLVLERQRQEGKATIERAMQLTNSEMSARTDYVDQIQTLLCLGWFATWQKDAALRNELHGLRALLANSLTLSGLDDISPCSAIWEVWAQQESGRRTKYFAFCFLNIQGMAYGMPPVVWAHDVKMRLPCSCPEWTAPDAGTWALLQQTVPIQRDRFSDALRSLLSTSEQRNLSPVANYVLLHGLIQSIMSNQIVNESLGVTSSSQSQALFQNALYRWTLGWEQTPESNLEPTDPNGPLPFISSTLLSFAYIRNCSSISLGRHRTLPWGPGTTADLFRISSPIERSSNELLAAQHAAHILESLVSLGIQYVQNHQPSVWNIEAALCSFQCFLFLGKWLRALQLDIQHKPLTDAEDSFTRRVQTIVLEGLQSITSSHAEVDLTRLDVLADQIFKLGSHAMRGNSPWPYIKAIGDLLGESTLS
ncbi:hypothetical protein BBP40_003780 [Aspergillus hancockii]|nr:hypothetical protein BBP40_003780 [Aspergillus hancockii]